MKIQFVTEQGRNPFKNAIVAAALDGGKTMTMSQCFVSFEVDVWSDYLKLVWKACAECTRDYRGQWCIERMPVTVTLKSGRIITVLVWYDVAAKGLRYVSLD